MKPSSKVRDFNWLQDGGGAPPGAAALLAIFSPLPFSLIRHSSHHAICKEIEATLCSTKRKFPFPIGYNCESWSAFQAKQAQWIGSDMELLLIDPKFMFCDW
jgi:hypothetical protein